MSFLDVGVLILIGLVGYVVSQYAEIHRKLPSLDECVQLLEQQPQVRRNGRAVLLFAAILLVMGLMQYKYRLSQQESGWITKDIARRLLVLLFVIVVFLRTAISYVRIPQIHEYPAKSNLLDLIRRISAVGWFPLGHGGFSAALIVAQVGAILLGGYLLLTLI